MSTHNAEKAGFCYMFTSSPFAPCKNPEHDHGGGVRIEGNEDWLRAVLGYTRGPSDPPLGESGDDQ